METYEYWAQDKVLSSIAAPAARKSSSGFTTILGSLLALAAAGLLFAGSARATPAQGKIKGTIGVKGELPKILPLQITKDQDVCKNVPNESLIVSPANGVQNVVVLLEKVPAAALLGPAREHPVFRLTNQDCRFVPHVLVMQFNEDLEVSNMDPILHTARTLQSEVNVGLFPGRTIRKEIGAPRLGPAKITCEIHPWMSAYVYLTDNPYYAVSDLHGEYEIDNVPPGKYRVRIWHELLGTEVGDIEVMPGKTSQFNFDFHSGQGPH